jgi:tetratricopeptide (TPR) repeat protein
MIRAVALVAGALLAAASASAEAKGPAGRRFEYKSKSEEARKQLFELQGRIENFQFGPENVERAKKIVALDPGFVMGQYYLSATTPVPADAEKEYLKAREMAKKGAEGDRRFVDAVYYARVNQGNDFKKAIEPMEKLTADYPGERLGFLILGQLYNGDGQGEKAVRAFEKARAIGPRSARVEAFLAADDLRKEQYAKARATYLDVEKSLPKGAVPFAIRFGVTFSHLYEGNTDAALDSLRTYLDEYRAAGLDKQFPEVFVWNAMARINLENGRLDEAMKDYEKGYESIPGSNLDEIQKKTWLGRLHHGKARTLARMGKHEQAWAEVETIKKMIEDGGEEAKQYWPAYHYVAGYAKLEAGDFAKAAEHLEQADKNDPFHTLLLARAYEKQGQKDKAKQAYQKVIESQSAGIERPLSYPEAKRKVQAL